MQLVHKDDTLRALDKDLIIQKVCKCFNIEPSEVFSNSSVRRIIEPRQIIITLSHYILNGTTKEKAEAININPYLVTGSIATVRNLYQTNKPYRERLHHILDEIGLNEKSKGLIIEKLSR